MGYDATATDILNDFPRYRNYNFLITELPVSDKFFLLSFLYKVEMPVTLCHSVYRILELQSQ